MIVNKPWGHENIWALTEKYVGKILHIKQGKRLSLQFHQVKEETIMVLEGTMELVLEEGSRREERRIIMNSGDTYHISPMTVHRFSASQGVARQRLYGDGEHCLISCQAQVQVS